MTRVGYKIVRKDGRKLLSINRHICVVEYGKRVTTLAPKDRGPLMLFDTLDNALDFFVAQSFYPQDAAIYLCTFTPADYDPERYGGKKFPAGTIFANSIRLRGKVL